MSPSPPGIDFEKVVAEVQQQVDPNATITHNRRLVDRLGHSRQFDVVIEGTFAGQQLLGVIECKDLKKRVGSPEIDAFVTKASDVNANFKIIVSKRGFTAPAIGKAKHYGIQTLSLLPNDEVNLGFKVGNYWYADIYYWESVSLTLLFREPPEHKVEFDAGTVAIDGRKLIDWFVNYLDDHHKTETELGPVVGVRCSFETDQRVRVSEDESYLCSGVEFHAWRGLMRKERFVGMNGTGLFDWQQSKVTVPPKATITGDAVPTDFEQWDDRDMSREDNAGFLQITIVAHNALQRAENPIALDKL